MSRIMGKLGLRVLIAQNSKRRHVDKIPRSLYEARRRGLIPAWAVDLADAILDWYDEDLIKTNRRGVPQRSVDVEPEWDNAVRALEDG